MSDRSRLPPGQIVTTKWPVLHYGNVPKVDPRSPNWRLRIFGQVEDEYDLSYDDLLAMPAVDVVCDMHCVTHWSRLDNTFTGVPTKAIIASGIAREGVRRTYPSAARTAPGRRGALGAGRSSRGSIALRAMTMAPKETALTRKQVLTPTVVMRIPAVAGPKMRAE